MHELVLAQLGKKSAQGKGVLSRLGQRREPAAEEAAEEETEDGDEAKPVAGLADWVQYRDDEGTPYCASFTRSLSLYLSLSLDRARAADYNLVTEETQWEAPKKQKPAPPPAKQKPAILARLGRKKKR